MIHTGSRARTFPTDAGSHQILTTVPHAPSPSRRAPNPVPLALTLLLLASPTTAQLAAPLGNPDGCARILGEEATKENEVAIVAGHLNLYGAICQITAVQTGTLMATCPGDADSRKKVLGIARSADGTGVTLTLPDGSVEDLVPCE
ncbi:hypothetical protein [Roseovarius sp.]|uniref:hypothetical protein n=1 Tax=Roseovarius sp. TaxID=1486281 RepID=UPI003B5BB900